jgi:hypothetical protein
MVEPTDRWIVVYTWRQKWELGGRAVPDGAMPRITLRLREQMLAAIDDLAAERGLTRTEVVRDLLAAGLRDRPTPEVDPLDERELLAVLNEAARRGNVSAARSLLARVPGPADGCARRVQAHDRGTEEGVVRLVEMAFGSLGSCPTLEELEAVARDLRDHGEPDDLALFEPIDDDQYAPVHGPLGDVAERCGSDWFSALDLLCEVRDAGSQRRVLERGRPMRQGKVRVRDVRDT